MLKASIMFSEIFLLSSIFFSVCFHALWLISLLLPLEVVFFPCLYIFSLSLFLSPFFLSLFSVFIFTAAAVGDNEDDDASLGWANFNYASA